MATRRYQVQRDPRGTRFKEAEASIGGDPDRVPFDNEVYADLARGVVVSDADGSRTRVRLIPLADGRYELSTDVVAPTPWDEPSQLQ